MIARVGSPKSRFKDANAQIELENLGPSGVRLDMKLPHGAVLHSTGIDLPKNLNFEQWKEIGAKLMTIDKGLQWAIGEWWRFGYHKYGERKAFADAKKVPFGFQRLMDIGTVVSKVPTSSRNEVLSFTHHRAVASLAPAEQKKWLDKAEKLDWTVEKLNQMMHESKTHHMALEPDHPDHEYEANIWAEGFIEEAKRSDGRLFPRSDDVRLDLVSERLLAALIEAAQGAAVFWVETAKQLASYREARLAAGKDFKPRIPNRVDQRLLKLEAKSHAVDDEPHYDAEDVEKNPKRSETQRRTIKRARLPRSAKNKSKKLAGEKKAA